MTAQHVQVQPRLLVVRPRRQGNGNGGDEVMYSHSLKYIDRMGITYDVIELQPVSRTMKMLNLLRLPAEIAGYAGYQNVERVRNALAQSVYDSVIFFNEVTFPSLPGGKHSGLRPILAAHNVQSVVASSDPSPIVRATGFLARAFERRYYADPDVALVCISQGDVDGLRAARIHRRDIAIAPPGAPPAADLVASAQILPVAVITGSYGWWRKKRDLRRLAAGAWTLPQPILANDLEALSIMGDKAERMEAMDWSSAVRFGIVSDRFVGGFKLKLLEYIANNCIVLACCDLSREVAALPHAAEFVRKISGLPEAAKVIAELSGDNRAMIERFRIFKKACLERYAWDNCLQPLGETVRQNLAEKRT